MRFFRFPSALRCILREAVFTTGRPGKTVCLSFDDGPDPITTPLILEILDRFNVKALFFLNGGKAEKHPALVEKIRNSGHITGNHGYSHLNGFKTRFKDYIDDIDMAARSTSSVLLRPPYGKITLRQYRYLIKRYAIVLWDLMPYDFDNSLTKEKILEIVLTKSRSGSIIVLHDKPDACSAEILERTITGLREKGFCFVVPVNPE